ncbi:MAG TPA: hypothetical protein VKZ81_14865 [Pseudonocardia sp.]|uniref:hypothetical protein n=1 Tax=Pseudonocardia sp. TaxID=60912 RepID=UPI002B4B76D4|nr:hypothetical protein [Pseudonocardia sp.]HLU56738.1 hypothetical protein [Pseudonocardia sp.]
MAEGMRPPSVDEWDDGGRFPVLRAMLENFARVDDGFGVTLYVDGKVITGHAVGRSAWLRALAGQTEHGNGAISAAVRVALRDVASGYEDEAPVHATQIQHVHLVNVTIQGPAATDVVRVPQLEVALARVSGWSLSNTPRHPG